MNVSIVGTGYVGLVTGACLASMGMNVLCCDQDEAKIANLKRGILPVYEPCLENLVDHSVRKQKRLCFTSDMRAAIEYSEVIFIAVNTPTLQDNTCDTSHVFDVARVIAHNMESYRLIVNKSTVPVGTGKKIRAMISDILHKRGVSTGFDIASNPEFLKEGSAIEDFINPDRIVIGADNRKAVDILKEVYSEQVSGNIPVMVTGIEEAEMIKYASNAFLAAKVSFINEIANLCEACNIDVASVSQGVGLDRRIGRPYLNAGPGFGGSCFPKDIRALIGTSREYGYEPYLLESVVRVNELQKERMVKKAEKILGGLEGKRITLLGLSFKPGTDDIRESPALSVLEQLLAGNARISAYDPEAMKTLKKERPDIKIRYCRDPYSACKNSECIMLLTEWKEFTNLDFNRLKTSVSKPVFLDLRNVYDPDYVKSCGFYYEGVGRK
ncbi:MAG TPA: UDP-glucose/GDP-mannose dehydrogenase family protein [Clostridia bacterium]|nr:UDP-glucose/GDP-mannose dehydrogenase family protein [Clostridia bacterium]